MLDTKIRRMKLSRLRGTTVSLIIWSVKWNCSNVTPHFFRTLAALGKELARKTRLRRRRLFRSASKKLLSGSFMRETTPAQARHSRTAAPRRAALFLHRASRIVPGTDRRSAGCLGAQSSGRRHGRAPPPHLPLSTDALDSSLRLAGTDSLEDSPARMH